MSTYVISDIHGHLDTFEEMLELIKLKANDHLYIVGDVLDRGPHPILLLKKIMDMSNVTLIMGNHDYMAKECLKVLINEEDYLHPKETDKSFNIQYRRWKKNGCEVTIEEFFKQSKSQQQEIVEYLENTPYFKKIEVNHQKYLLVHAGLGNFNAGKKLEEYTPHELVWDRHNYDEKYFEDILTITGHTPTLYLEDKSYHGRIYKNDKNHIAIDCGSYYQGGCLGCLCLDTLEEFYTPTNNEGELK